MFLIDLFYLHIHLILFFFFDFDTSVYFIILLHPMRCKLYSYAHCKGKHLLPRSTTDRCQEGIYSSVDLYNSAPRVWTSLSGRVCTRDSVLPVQIPVWRIKNNHRRVSCINVAFISYTLIDVSSTCTHKYAFFITEEIGTQPIAVLFGGVGAI